MLKALYDYGIRNHVAVPPGFMRKAIRAYICLSAEGEYLGVLPCSEEFQVCPDIGSLANGPDKCNPLAEKIGVILDAEGKKGLFFRKVLKDGGSNIPAFGVCLSALEDQELCDTVRKEMKTVKIKDQDRISFRVDGLPITAAEGTVQWWVDHRQQYTSDGDSKRSSEMTRCLITGELTTPLSTLPAISGLQRVGGKALVPLFCFDKSAFCSYGLKKSTNAPVSEEAFAVVKDALNDLLAGAPAMYRRDKNRDFTPSAPVYAGMMFLHWYDCQIEPRQDLILPAFEGFNVEDEEEDTPLSSEETEAVEKQEVAQARAKADQLVKSVTSGTQLPPLKTQYHILLLSANSGRAVIHRYEHGSYAELQKNLTIWNEDMALADDRFGTGTLRPCKLFARLCRLVKDQGKSGADLYEQLGKELAGVTPAIITAILNGTPLPDAVAVRALAYIRSQMLRSREEEKQLRIPDGRACQWLKVWLARKRRARNEEVLTMPYYDSTFPSAAYHCGALTAIYANLQNAAMGELNAGIVERYYASASRTPTLVLGTLERMGQVYLGMLAKQDKRKLAKKYQNRLNETYAFFGKDGLHQLPAALTLEEQSFFALGYRQMCTQINADIINAKANKEEDA